MKRVTRNNLLKFVEMRKECESKEDFRLFYRLGEGDDKAFSVCLSDRDLLSYLKHFSGHKKEAFRKLSLRHKLKYLISKHIKAR